MSSKRTKKPDSGSESPKRAPRGAKKPAKRGRAPRGRPSALTPTVAAAIFERIRAGGTLEGAAAHAGVSSRTVRGWVLAAKSGVATRDEADFAEGLSNAYASAKSGALEAIRNGVNVAGFDDWRAREVWLRLKFPEEFGAKAINEKVVRQKIEHLLGRVTHRLSDAAREEFLNILEQEMTTLGLLAPDPDALPAEAGVSSV